MRKENKVKFTIEPKPENVRNQRNKYHEEILAITKLKSDQCIKFDNTDPKATKQKVNYIRWKLAKEGVKTGYTTLVDPKYVHLWRK